MKKISFGESVPQKKKPPHEIMLGGFWGLV
jgi:hypothetical protein